MFGVHATTSPSTNTSPSPIITMSGKSVPPPV